jgi:uncharacterized protein YbjT (DUF2867 family)
MTKQVPKYRAAAIGLKSSALVVRDRTEGAAWADRGCEVGIADLDDANAFAAAFEDAEGPSSWCRRSSTPRRASTRRSR